MDCVWAGCKFVPSYDQEKDGVIDELVTSQVRMMLDGEKMVVVLAVTVAPERRKRQWLDEFCFVMIEPEYRSVKKMLL